MHSISFVSCVELDRTESFQKNVHEMIQCSVYCAAAFVSRRISRHGKTLLNHLFTISTSLSTCWYVRAQGRERPVEWLHVQFPLELALYPEPKLRLLSSQRCQLESLVSLCLLVLAETVQEREHYVRDVLFPYRTRTAWDNCACGLVVWCKFWRPDLPETLLAQGK